MKRVRQEAQHSGVRRSGRVRKQKIFYDPSHHNVTRAQKRVSATGTEATLLKNETATRGSGITSLKDSGKVFDTCTVCHVAEAKPGRGCRSKFLLCKPCKKKWHINCLDMQFKVYRFARDRFQCDKCRICSICFQNKWKISTFLVCSHCAFSYHFECHYPNLNQLEVPDGSWMCYHCTENASQVFDGSYDNVISSEVLETAPQLPEPLAPVSWSRPIAYDDFLIFLEVPEPEPQQLLPEPLAPVSWSQPIAYDDFLIFTEVPETSPQPLVPEPSAPVPCSLLPDPSAPSAWPLLPEPSDREIRSHFVELRPIAYDNSLIFSEVPEIAPQPLLPGPSAPGSLLPDPSAPGSLLPDPSAPGSLFPDPSAPSPRPYLPEPSDREVRTLKFTQY